MDTAWKLIAGGQRPQAMVLLRDLVKKDPRNVDARLLLGSLLMEDGDRPESIAQLSEAVRLRPQSADAQNALGEAYAASAIPNRRSPALNAPWRSILHSRRRESIWDRLCCRPGPRNEPSRT